MSVRLDDAAIAEMFADPGGFIADYLDEVAQEVTDTAKILAPVSSRGSRYSRPGNLKAAIKHEAGMSAEGTVMQTVSAPGYPAWFVGNWKRVTQNANLYGHYGERPADKLFLRDSINAATAKGLF